MGSTTQKTVILEGPKLAMNLLGKISVPIHCMSTAIKHTANVLYKRM
jgi:hypothetical protein